MPTSGGLQQRNDHVHFSPSTSVTPVKTSDSGAFAQLNHSKSAFFGGIEEPTTPKTTKRHLRYGLSAMLMLTLQGTILAIVLRYSRIKSGRRYLPSVAVCTSECIKLCICLAVQLIWKPSNPQPPPSLISVQTPHANGTTTTTNTNNNNNNNINSPSPSSLSSPSSPLSRRITLAVHQALPMALPAVMFTLQQVLLIAAATYLDAVTYQIFNQAFKLVPTAFFARWLLGQRLDPMQWASIPVLALGVVLVTLNNGPTTEAEALRPVSQANWLLGMAACSLSGLSSAFAGVYFEKYVKGRHAPNLWVRNIELSAFGAPFSAALAIVKDGSAIRKNGWLQGFSTSVWVVVALQIIGGLATGMVVKYCDNIIKNFALAVSVILTVCVAIPLFGQTPSMFFLVGVLMVLLSVFMYGKSINMETARRWFGQRPVSKMMMTMMAGIVFLGVSGGLFLYRIQSTEKLV